MDAGLACVFPEALCFAKYCNGICFEVAELPRDHASRPRQVLDECGQIKEFDHGSRPRRMLDEYGQIKESGRLLTSERVSMFMASAAAMYDNINNNKPLDARMCVCCTCVRLTYVCTAAQVESKRVRRQAGGVAGVLRQEHVQLPHG